MIILNVSSIQLQNICNNIVYILWLMGNKLQLLLVLHLLVHHLHYVLQYVTCNLQLAADSSLDYCSNAASSSCNHLGSTSAAVTDLYPFAFSSSPSAPCAFSPFFRLSNCSNSQHAAYWDAFAAPTINPNDVNISPPAVMGISRVNSSTYINVTWDSDLISDPSKYISVCSTPPVPRTNLSHTFPPSINLTAYSSITIPSNNVYLLFNCAHSTDYNIDLANFYTLEASTALCQIYRDHCAIKAEYYTSPCVQLLLSTSLMEGSTDQLLFQNAMDNLDCTHFQFFVTKTGSADTAVTEWGKAILQLQWTDPSCSKYCFPAETHSGGSCVFDSTNHTLKKCVNCTFGEGKNGFCKSSSPYSSIIPVLLIMIIVGASFLINNILLALIYCCRRIRRRRSISVKKLSKSPACRNIGAWPQELSSGSSNESLDLNGLSERPMEYSYSSIASATSSFSSKVGEGGFGTVFKGALHDNEGGAVVQEIAVKVLEVRSKHSRKQFLNEVAIIGRIHHVNVVRLLGFCVKQKRQEEEELRHGQSMLVYEYVVNGSLDTWLFNTCSKRATAGGGGPELEYGGAEKVQVQEMQGGLEWGQRYGIALGIARGLSYLHEECRHRIVHCDIKPHNILLDAAMCPKIADFGLARLISRDESRVVTLAKGTPGYMAPEFWLGGDIHLSTKADVYSYGMVLLEIVSGRRNFAAFGCHRFPAVAFQAAMRGDFESILDVRLLQAGTLMTSSSPSAITAVDHEDQEVFLMWQQVRTAIFVALWCIQDNPTSRPYMSEVVQYLEGIAAVSEQPPLPAVACTCTCTTMTSPLAPICLNSDSHGLLLQDQTPISQGR